MSEVENWELKPQRGLGLIAFGMTYAEIDRLGLIYGATTGHVADRISDDLLQSTLAELGDGLSEEEKREILSAYEQDGPSADSETEVRGDDGSLVLGYSSGQLVELMATESAKKLRFDGSLLFAEEPLELIRRMATSLSETPLIFKEEVIFPKHHVYLFEFVVEAARENGEVTSYSAGSHKDRSITWRADARSNSVELARYAPMKL